MSVHVASVYDFLFLLNVLTPGEFANNLRKGCNFNIENTKKTNIGQQKKNSCIYFHSLICDCCKISEFLYLNFIQ